MPVISSNIMSITINQKDEETAFRLTSEFIMQGLTPVVVLLTSTLEATVPMARRKSELNEKLWKGEEASGCRSAESFPKMFLLVVINCIFLLAALHVLHSRHELENASLTECITDRLNNARPIAHIPKNDLAKQEFETYGVAVHLFVKMSAYRGSANSFAVVGLEAKHAAELYHDPPYECVWTPGAASRTWTPLKGVATKMLPDTGNYSRLYSAVIINCTFAQDVGVDRKGGELVLYASYGDHYPRSPERIVALREGEDEFPGHESVNYDYVYCGSPLFGNISPGKIREWVAYHAHFFGPRSHFFLYDAGGVHAGVRRVLDPWIRAGRVTLDDVRGQERFDGYYHNQFMVVNDCFHRARHLAPWLFFFDVDEFVWAPPGAGSLASIVARYENQSQIIIWQKPMSKSLCVAEDAAKNNSKWTFEKLVFKSIKVRETNDCKYAIQGRRAMSTGIHRSGHLIGGNATAYADPLFYYHFHNTINKRGEVCEEFVNRDEVYVSPWNKSDRYAFDGGLAAVAERVKQFEVRTIGLRG